MKYNAVYNHFTYLQVYLTYCKAQIDLCDVPQKLKLIIFYHYCYYCYYYYCIHGYFREFRESDRAKISTSMKLMKNFNEIKPWRISAPSPKPQKLWRIQYYYNY